MLVASANCYTVLRQDNNKHHGMWKRNAPCDLVITFVSVLGHHVLCMYFGLLLCVDEWIYAQEQKIQKLKADIKSLKNMQA